MSNQRNLITPINLPGQLGLPGPLRGGFHPARPSAIFHSRNLPWPLDTVKHFFTSPAFPCVHDRWGWLPAGPVHRPQGQAFVSSKLLASQSRSYRCGRAGATWETCVYRGVDFGGLCYVYVCPLALSLSGDGPACRGARWAARWWASAWVAAAWSPCPVGRRDEPYLPMSPPSPFTPLLSRSSLLAHLFSRSSLLAASARSAIWLICYSTMSLRKKAWLQI
jgi:hypothetical protein